MHSDGAPQPDPGDADTDVFFFGDFAEAGAGATSVRRRWPVRAFQALVLLLVVVIMIVAGYLWSLEQVVSGNLSRLPDNAFAGLDSRPAPAKTDADGRSATNVLLLGSDQRAGVDADSGVTGQRSDTMVLAHLSADRERADLISIPRDSWVDIPGHGRAKINAALAYGGVPLAVQTVEKLTNVRIDHVMSIGFQGLRDVTTALGGVPVDNPFAVTDPRTHTFFAKGRIVLQGEKALTFVRQRYGLAGGDFDRIKRQQMLISAIGDKLAASNTIANPAKLHRVVDVMSRNVTVDSGLTVQLMQKFLVQLGGIGSGDVHFYTAPTDGTGTSADGQSYVALDMPGLAEVTEALREDKPIPLDANHP